MGERRNMRRDNPALANRWRDNCRASQLQFVEEDDESYIAKADLVAALLPTDHPYNPVKEVRRKGTRSREQTAEWLARKAEHEGAGDEGCYLLERSIFGVSRFEVYWDALTGVSPDDEDDSLEGQWDAEPEVEAAFRAACRLPARPRFPAIRRVLNEADDRCTDTFAQKLSDEAERRFPGFRKYDLATIEGYHRRGRHKKQQDTLPVAA